MTVIFHDTYDLVLHFSRSKFEIALSQGSEGQLTWNEVDVSQSFMTMIVTFLWPWWGGWMFRITTQVISDISVPWTNLVFHSIWNLLKSIVKVRHRLRYDTFKWESLYKSMTIDQYTKSSFFVNHWLEYFEMMSTILEESIIGIYWKFSVN